MRDFTLVGCGHCGIGVLASEAPRCAYQGHALCEDCFAAVTKLVATLQAQGHDPLPKRQRQHRRKPRVAAQRPLL
jgi:hypothetical protein